MSIKDFYWVQESSDKLYTYLKNLNLTQEEKDILYELIENYCDCKVQSIVNDVLSSL